jgi:hypothetical protein
MKDEGREFLNWLEASPLRLRHLPQIRLNYRRIWGRTNYMAFTARLVFGICKIIKANSLPKYRTLVFGEVGGADLRG